MGWTLPETEVVVRIVRDAENARQGYPRPGVNVGRGPWVPPEQSVTRNAQAFAILGADWLCSIPDGAERADVVDWIVEHVPPGADRARALAATNGGTTEKPVGAATLRDQNGGTSLTTASKKA